MAEIERCKGKNDTRGFEKKLGEAHRTFVHNDAPKCINLSSKTRNTVKKAVKAIDRLVAICYGNQANTNSIDLKQLGNYAEVEKESKMNNPGKQNVIWV